MIKTLRLLVAGLSASLMLSTASSAMSLEDAIRLALETNPEILESFENREAIEFELQQARGAFLPTIDLDASVGRRDLDNSSRRSLGVENKQLNPADVGVTLRQSLFAGGARKADVARQAARVDGASYRALDRMELVALAVSREYLEYLLQQEIVSLTRRNLQQINSITAGINVKIQNDVLTVAEGKLARERQQSAAVRMKEAEQELVEAAIRFERLVGQRISNARLPRGRNIHLPKTLGSAIAQATQSSPRMGYANADIDAAGASVREAEAAYLPRVDLEASARYGTDADGSDGTSTDLQARVVARWNIFNGGRDVARVQEAVRRTGEAKYAKDILLRETVELVKSAWNRRSKQADLAQALRSQANTNAGIVRDYREQFDVDQRSLLDVLGAENTRFNTEIAARNAAYGAVFAEYEILAAVGILAASTGYAAPEQTIAYAREEFGVENFGDVSGYNRLPARQISGKPLNLLAPIE